MTREELIGKLQGSISQLTRDFGVAKLGIFGSYAKGIPSADSDVDIVVEFEHPLGLRFIDFSDRIEHILGLKADILTPTGISSIRDKAVSESIKESTIYVKA